MPYRISDYSYRQARKLGVQIKPSRRKGKKIDVLKNGQRLHSIGATGYKDYPTYLSLERKGKVPKGTAAKKRKAYWARSGKPKRYAAGWYAQRLLW
jgi:hypothetical protein